MAEVTGSTKTIILDNEEVTGNTRTRKIIVVGHIGDNIRLIDSIERLKNSDKNLVVEIITPEQAREQGITEEALERGITITSEELIRPIPEPFILTNPYGNRTNTDYESLLAPRKGKRGYTSPYKYHR